PTTSVTSDVRSLHLWIPLLDMDCDERIQGPSGDEQGGGGRQGQAVERLGRLPEMTQGTARSFCAPSPRGQSSAASISGDPSPGSGRRDRGDLRNSRSGD